MVGLRHLELAPHVRLSIVVTLVKLAAFALIAHLATSADVFHSRDTVGYLASVPELLARGRFWVAGAPETLRTPGYPLLLAVATALTGTPTVAIGIQIVLAGFAAALLGHTAGLLARDKWRNATAMAATAILLVDPSFSIVQFRLLSEALFVAVLCMGLYLLVKAHLASNSAYFIAAMATFGAAALIRPVAVYYFLLCAVWYVLTARRNWRTAVPVALAGVLAALLFVGGWQARNRAVADYDGISTIAEVNLYEYVAASVSARAEGRSWKEVREEHQTHFRDLSLQARSDSLRHAAWRILSANPAETAAVGIKGLATNAFDPGTGSLASILGLRESRSGIIYRYYDMPTRQFVHYLLAEEKPLVFFLVLGGFWVLFLWVSVCAGGRQLYEVDRAITFYLCLSATYFLVLSAGPNAMARFRIAALPFLAILAGMGFSFFLAHFGKIHESARRQES